MAEYIDYNNSLDHFKIRDYVIKSSLQIVAGIVFRAFTTVYPGWGVKYLTLPRFIIFTISI